MSAPASAWTSACSTRIALVVVVEHIARRVDEPVMAVRGIGIERDVGEHADLGRRILRRLDRAADQIVRVERLARIVGAQAGRRVGEQGDAGNAEVARLARPRADPVDRPARHAGQASRSAPPPPALRRRTSGQIRSDGRQHGLGDQRPAPGGGAGAAQAKGGEGGGGMSRQGLARPIPPAKRRIDERPVPAPQRELP